MLKIKEAVVQMCSVKKVFLEISKNSQENTCARVSFLIKLQAFPVFGLNTERYSVSLRIQSECGKACSFIKKETLAQVFSCEFFEISKNTFF